MTQVDRSTVSLPVIVHRWFERGGENWAYHPDLKKKLVNVVDKLTPKINELRYNLNDTDAVPLVLRVSQDIVVGQIYRDENCNFPVSADRDPFLLSAFVISPEAAAILKDIIFADHEQTKVTSKKLLPVLRRVSLPKKQGANSRLIGNINIRGYVEDVDESEHEECGSIDPNDPFFDGVDADDVESSKTHKVKRRRKKKNSNGSLYYVAMTGVILSVVQAITLAALDSAVSVRTLACSIILCFFYLLYFLDLRRKGK